jgi:predicted dehydrogenase
VVIATTPQDHLAPAIAAMEKGLHVVCEKPLSPAPADAWRLVEAAESAAGVSAVNFEFRLSDGRLALKRALESGVVGTIRSVAWSVRHPSVDRLAGFPHSWLWEREGGGLLLALGSHYLDTVNWLAGPFASDGNGTTWSVVDTHGGVWTDADDAFEVSVGLEAGGVAGIAFTPTHGFFESSLCIVGSSGTLLLDDRAGVLRLHDGRAERVLHAPGPDAKRVDIDDLIPRLARFAELFVRSVDGERSRDLATFREAAVVQDVLSRAAYCPLEPATV